MKTTRKAFTFLELLVTTGIIPLFAVMTHISLQGYSQDAQNSRVASDVRSLASVVEMNLMEGYKPFEDFVEGNGRTANKVSAFTQGRGTYGWGMEFDLNDTKNNLYNAWNINFTTLEMDRATFQDENGNVAYKIGILRHNDTTKNRVNRMFQIVGASGWVGAYQAYVLGNYIFDESMGDETGLVAQSSDQSRGLQRGDPIKNKLNKNEPGL